MKGGRRRWAEIVAALKARLREGGLPGLAKRKGYGRYIEARDGGEAKVNWEKVNERQRYDERFVLGSNIERSA